VSASLQSKEATCQNGRVKRLPANHSASLGDWCSMRATAYAGIKLSPVLWHQSPVEVELHAESVEAHLAELELHASLPSFTKTFLTPYQKATNMSGGTNRPKETFKSFGWGQKVSKATH